MDLAVIGAGRVGTALAVLWGRAGHRVVGVAGRGATLERAARFLPGVPVLEPGETARGAEVVVLATPDERIAVACGELVAAGSLARGTAVAHVSGALGLDVLEPARSAGAAVMSVHPLQTCPSVETALERIPGSAFAVTAVDEEGFALASRLARDAGGRPFRLDDAMKPLYHAAAVIASNSLVALSALAEELDRAAGVPDAAGALAALQRATLANVERLGPGAALTGPVARGDALTIERNLEALAEHAPDAVAPYVALARLTLAVAERSGRLDPRGRARVEEALQRWS